MKKSSLGPILQPMAINYTTPASAHDLELILDLQKANIPSNISAEVLAQQGFVTVQHSIQLLTEMNAAAPQVIAKEGNKLAGYALVMLISFQNMVPVLVPMFQKLKTLHYKGKPLSQFKYYVIGQVCVAEAYRGRGIFEGLYKKHKELYAGHYDFCVTEVATRNPRSVRAHQKIGFETIHAFTDTTDTWEIIAWDWK